MRNTVIFAQAHGSPIAEWEVRKIQSEMTQRQEEATTGKEQGINRALWRRAAEWGKDCYTYVVRGQLGPAGELGQKRLS